MKILLILAQVFHLTICYEDSDKNTNTSQMRSDYSNTQDCHKNTHKITYKNTSGTNIHVCVKDNILYCVNWSQELGLCRECRKGYQFRVLSNHSNECYCPPSWWSKNWTFVKIIIFAVIAFLVTLILCCFFKCLRIFQGSCCKAMFCCFKRKRPLSSSTANYLLYENANNWAYNPQQPQNQLSVNMKISYGTNLQDTNNLTTKSKSSPNQIPINPVGSYDTNQPSLIPPRSKPTNIVNQPQPYTNNYQTNLNTDNQPTIYNQNMNNVRPYKPVVNDIYGMNSQQNLNYPAPPEN